MSSHVDYHKRLDDVVIGTQKDSHRVVNRHDEELYTPEVFNMVEFACSRPSAHVSAAAWRVAPAMASAALAT